MKSYENSLRNYKYLVTNSSTNTEKKFKTTLEITDQLKIPKSTIYHILWGRECQKWEEQIRKHWYTKKHKKMKAEKEIKDKQIKEDKKDEIKIEKNKKLGIKSEFVVIFE